MQNEDEKIDILNGSLRLWREIHQTNQRSLERAFRAGMTPSENISLARMSMEGAHTVHGNAGRLEWLHALLNLAAEIDTDKTFFYLQTDTDPETSPGILINLIGPVLISNNIPNISFSESNRSGDGDVSITWNGPVIPIWYSNITAEESRRSKFRQLVSLFPTNEIMVIVVREDTLQVALTELQSTSQQKLKSSCLRSFQNNQSLCRNGLFNLSFLYVKSNQETAPIKELIHCSNTGCTVQAEKMDKCAKCRTPYCTRACQVADWPQHKRVCKKRQQGIYDEESNDTTTTNNTDDSDNNDASDATETRPYVMIDAKPDPNMYDEAMGGKGGGKETVTMGFSTCGGIAIPQQKISKSKKLPFRSYEFIVKVQGTPTGASILIYDEKRIIHLNSMAPSVTQPIHHFTSRFREPYPGVSIHPGNMKIFLYARVVQGDLRLFLDKVAPWQNW